VRERKKDCQLQAIDRFPVDRAPDQWWHVHYDFADLVTLLSYICTAGGKRAAPNKGASPFYH